MDVKLCPSDGRAKTYNSVLKCLHLRKKK